MLQESDYAFVHQILSYFRTHEESQTAAVKDRGSFLVGRMHALKQYGPIYLTPEEYERRYRERLDEYYRMLANAVLELRDKAYWAYHRDKMQMLGIPLSRTRLAGAVLTHITDRVLPFRALWRWLSLAARRAGNTGSAL